MAEEEAVVDEARDQFPNEATDAEPVEIPAEEPDEDSGEGGKWVVAECYPDGLKIITSGFRLMTDADAWIRENLKEGQVLIPLRLGVPRKLEVQRRVVEADL